MRKFQLTSINKKSLCIKNKKCFKKPSIGTSKNLFGYSVKEN